MVDYRKLAFTVLAVVCLFLGLLFFYRGLVVLGMEGFFIFETGTLWVAAAWGFWCYAGGDAK